MSRHLCISATFLDRAFHGKADGDSPEWPPSPLRLFQALLAGARAGGRVGQWSTAQGEAFRWLERQGPPLIIAPEVDFSRGFTTFVPNNDGDQKPIRESRLTGKQVQPIFLRDGSSVHYLWPLEEEEWIASRHQIEWISSEARHLFALGWGIDCAFAEGRLMNEGATDQLSGIRWRPSAVAESRTGDVRRVPVAGTLENLEDVYRSFCETVDGKSYRPRSKPAVFGSVVYLTETSMSFRPCARFEFVEEVAFRQEETSIVGAMLRGRTCELAKADTHDFPGGSEKYVAGHLARQTAAERFSYLPLPTIGHPHADGMIRRVLIAEPHGGDGSHARWVQSRVRNASLRDEGGQERTLLLEPWRAGRVWELYLDYATAWSSVTPVILPGHDDHDSRRKAPALFLKAVEQAGIPRAAVAELQLRKAPFWPGSQHPRQYRRPGYLKHFPAWHAFIRFREPFPGPLAIGAGRHCGLGLFAAANA